MRAVRSINSVAAEMRASLMVEGELLEEGQVVLDGDGCEAYLALARRLAGSEAGVDGRGQSLEALFAEARRSEDEADQLLVEGGREEEPEVPREPIPFPARPAPVDVGQLNDLPLFASNAAVSAPAGATTSGKIVTLEDLAQMVRRRKPRPKPVPEGQLALFGT